MSEYSFPKKKRVKSNRFSKIVSSASYFPERIVTNEEIISKNNLPFAEKIIEKSVGVKERRVSPDGIADSDLLSEAARRCLDKAGLKPEDLSRVIVTTFIGDRQFPMTASMVLKKLECKIAIQGFDMEGGSNSFLQALDLSEKYINTGDDYILILSGGICNKFISKTDPRTAFLFGDGASAILVGKADSEHFSDSYFYSNYNYFDNVKGYSVKGISESICSGKIEDLYDSYKLDNWKVVEDFYLEATDEIVKNVLTDNGLNIEDIDLVFLTENNRPLKNSILKRLGISEDKSETILESYGNTMSAMLPLLYNKAEESGKLKKGMNILFLSHGEGVSGGGIVYKINEEINNG